MGVTCCVIALDTPVPSCRGGCALSPPPVVKGKNAIVRRSSLGTASFPPNAEKVRSVVQHTVRSIIISARPNACRSCCLPALTLASTFQNELPHAQCLPLTMSAFLRHEHWSDSQLFGYVSRKKTVSSDMTLLCRLGMPSVLLILPFSLPITRRLLA